MKIQIFYSWQTTTSTKYNKNFIFNCIEKAIADLNRKPNFKDVEFTVLEGVRGEPGSPSLADKIIEDRIPRSDIFIADLSVVNHLSGWRKVLAKWVGIKHRPMQNNNVVLEHGVARSVLGDKRLIGVLNTSFGSPNDDASNITFDVRHMRFPIEYSYNKKTTDKSLIQKKLVSDLSAAIRDCSLEVLSYRQSRFAPFVNWSDWATSIGETLPFIQNQKFEELKLTLSNAITGGEQSIRILGLPGLGKTRTIFESFRADGSDASKLITGKVLYINDHDHTQLEYSSVIRHIAIEQPDSILIIDNCSIDKHRRVASLIKQSDNRISFISIGSNPEENVFDEIAGVSYVKFATTDFNLVVDGILDQNFGMIRADRIERIRFFSQGIPLMAVLLAVSAQKDGPFHGLLSDRELLDKLLGSKYIEGRWRNMLKSCALFSYFGYYEDVAFQAEFIATNKALTSIDGTDAVIISEFREVCEYYLKRGVFEKRGRFIGMRPFPLAMSLAQEWLEICTPQRLLDVINGIADLPETHKKSLFESFSEQMKYLGYNQKAVEIVERISGPGSPFDDAEVLNTQLGSRLFRSFVEVNPVAISNTLARAFSGKSDADLLLVKDGRRNIVWTLEKLCFDKRTFVQATKILFRFAVAENENISNNATGQLLQIFGVYLAGTEVSLRDRLTVLDWALSLDHPEYNKMLIAIYRRSLNVYSAHRISGAERQGNRILVDYQPNIDEILEYWEYSLQKLVFFVKKNDLFSSQAMAVLSDAVVPVYRNGYSEIILRYLEEVAAYKNYDWDSALHSLQSVRKFDENLIQEEVSNSINLLIDRLTKHDFVSRYINLNSTLLGSDGHLAPLELYQVEIERIANDFASSNSTWANALHSFFTNHIPYPILFGQAIYSHLGQDIELRSEFFDLACTELSANINSSTGLSILAGFVSSADSEQRDDYYKRLFNNPDVCSLLFNIIAIDPDGDRFFHFLFELARQNPPFVSRFRFLGSGRAIYTLSEESILLIISELFQFEQLGYEAAFSITSDIILSDTKSNDLLFPILRTCLIETLPNALSGGILNDYRWVQSILKLLELPDQAAFAQLINAELIRQIEDYSFNQDFAVQEIYNCLIHTYFGEIWPDLSNALLGADDKYLTFYRLKSLLGSQIGSSYRRLGILFHGDLEAIFEWCKRHEPLAPARLAEMCPIFSDGNRNFTELSVVAKRLIDEFGQHPEVLSAIGANLGSFSWTGSVVPYLTAQLSLFVTLQSHALVEVREWAARYAAYTEKEIEREKNRDDEMYFV